MGNPGKSRRAASETGAMPRVDVEPAIQHEPLEPPTLPEFDDNGGITGTLPRFAEEGEDEAKHADDSATSTV